MQPLRTIETDALYIHEVESDVHYVVMKDKEITRSVFQDMLEAHIKLSEGKKVFVISDHSRANHMTREALFFARQHAPQVVHTLVLINKNKVARMLSDFFVKVVRPPFDTKLVEDYDSAISWIGNQRSS